MSYLRDVATAVALLLPFILLYKFWRRNSKHSIVNDDDDSTSEADTIPDSTNPSGLFPSVEYEVFLSFRGPDTRYQITDILYRFLCRTKIHTFRDDDELRKGEEIGSNLLRAIYQSKIYVPIISRGYANSKWCLMELAEIVRYQELDTRRIIFPIFYMVDPKDVRHQTGHYRKAFQEHATKYDEMTIQNWKNALNKVGTLKGWHVKNNDEQGAIADEVSANIWSRISKENFILETDELVGIDDHVEAILKTLSLDSESVAMVGLYGMGGIGKTTTAKAVYNKISSHFDRCCFVDNVRAMQEQKDGIFILQKKLVSEILRMDSVGFTNDSGGRKMIKERVSKFKILVVLDDVDEKFKFEDILGCPKDFDSGTRFIITSRNQNVLSRLNENQCKLYEVGSMSQQHSLELFSKHAFKKDTPPSDYETLANDIVSTTGGLPLTLKVTGSLLFRQEIGVWEDTLEQLRKTLDLDEVYDRLKISYDALKAEAKEIFLDIACFFIGRNKEQPYYMWSDCNFYPKSNIIFLIQRCMIQVGDDGVFQMHDQLRDMGREIVRREDVERPWKRSRICSSEEGIDLLLNKKGSSKVKAISIPKTWKSTVKCEFKSECFLNLSELRYFHASSAMLTGDFNNLLPNLKWLHLPKYSHYREDDPPLTNFTMKNLVILDLPNTKKEINSCWSHMMKMAPRLKVLQLYSVYGVSERLPFCWRFPKSIEVLSMSRIEIKEVDIGELKKLKTLDLSSCRIQKISGGTFGMLKGLIELHLEAFQCTNLREVVADICQLSSLKILKIDNVKEVEINEFPLGLKELSTSSRIPNLLDLLDLEELKVYDCKDGIDIPPANSNEDEGSVWWKVSKLKSLTLRNTRINIKVVDASSGGHYLLPSSLTSLVIYWCKEPTWLPGIENLENLTSLVVNDIFQTLGGDLDGLQGLRSLEILRIRKVNGLVRIKGLMDLLCSSTCKLRKLEIGACHDLTEILPCELHDQTVVVPSFEKLTIRDCPRLEVGPMIRSLPKFPMLKKLDLAVANITKEEDLDVIGSLQELVDLRLELDDTSSGIERIASLSKLKKLTTLRVKVPSLREIEELAALKSLQRLILEGCTSLERLRLEKLKEPDIGGCPDLTELVQTVVVCPSLVELTIRDCPRLEEDLDVIGSLQELVDLRLELDDTSSGIERIASLSKLKKLTTLRVKVPSLLEFEGLAELKSLRKLILEGCTSLRRLRLEKLKEPDIGGCPDLTELVQTVVVCPSLVELTIRDCPRLEVGPMIRSLPKFPMLKKLDLAVANIIEEDLDVIGSLEELVSLELELDDTSSSSIERISFLSKLQKLSQLRVKVPSLREIEGLAELKSLQDLFLEGCTSLERLWPDEQQLDNNKSMWIDIRGCKSLSVDHLSALKSTLPPNVKIRWPDE
uniref:M1 n=1 Tax=Linum usitatissimum TaxID=4006 RepID=C6JW22_LINUS|nr:M1 [Linum usitatissimum]